MHLSLSHLVVVAALAGYALSAPNDVTAPTVRREDLIFFDTQANADFYDMKETLQTLADEVYKIKDLKPEQKKKGYPGITVAFKDATTKYARILGYSVYDMCNGGYKPPGSIAEVAGMQKTAFAELTDALCKHRSIILLRQPHKLLGLLTGMMQMLGEDPVVPGGGEKHLSELYRYGGVLGYGLKEKQGLVGAVASHVGHVMPAEGLVQQMFKLLLQPGVEGYSNTNYPCDVEPETGSEMRYLLSRLERDVAKEGTRLWDMIVYYEHLNQTLHHEKPVPQKQERGIFLYERKAAVAKKTLNEIREEVLVALMDEFRGKEMGQVMKSMQKVCLSVFGEQEEKCTAFKREMRRMGKMLTRQRKEEEKAYMERRLAYEKRRVLGLGGTWVKKDLRVWGVDASITVVTRLVGLVLTLGETLPEELLMKRRDGKSGKLGWAKDMEQALLGMDGKLQDSRGRENASQVATWKALLEKIKVFRQALESPARSAPGFTWALWAQETRKLAMEFLLSLGDSNEWYRMVYQSVGEEMPVRTRQVKTHTVRSRATSFSSLS